MGSRQETELPSEEDFPYRAINIKEDKSHRNVSSASRMLRKSHFCDIQCKYGIWVILHGVYYIKIQQNNFWFQLNTTIYYILFLS
jgi:hypothetical protein